MRRTKRQGRRAIRSPLSAPFVPTRLSDCTLWLRADKGVSPGAIATWPDQSGSGNNATQATGTAQPTVVSNVINGHPIVRFDGVGTWLGLPDLMAGATAGEWFIVLKNAVHPPTDTAKTGLWKMGAATNGSHYPWTDNVLYEPFGSTTRHQWTNAAALASAHLYNVHSAAADWAARINGTVVHSTATNVVGWPTAPRIGMQDLGGSFWYNGDIAEVIGYRRKLTTTERAQVNAYVAGRYGITVA